MHAVPQATYRPVLTVHEPDRAPDYNSCGGRLFSQITADNVAVASSRGPSDNVTVLARWARHGTDRRTITNGIGDGFLTLLHVSCDNCRREDD